MGSLDNLRKKNEERRLKAALEFIDKANKTHNGFYKDGYGNVKYINTRTKVEIKCPIEGHGSFFQTPLNHIRNRGCPICGYIKSFNKNKEQLHINGQKSNEHKRLKASLNFKDKSKIIHGDRYSYEKVNYITCEVKVEIICKEHGSFFQNPRDHVKGHGCPICNYSHGEREIWKFLKESGVSFIPQYTFEDCRGDYKELPFDFYLPDMNILIEYDGEGHFEYIPGFHSSRREFERTQRYDRIKDEYAVMKRIKLLRVSYKDNLGEFLNRIKENSNE
jgi:hypothetical protein